MRLEPVELDEGARIEQLLDALAGRELAFLVLAAQPLLAAAEERVTIATFELLEILLDTHRAKPAV